MEDASFDFCEDYLYDNQKIVSFIKNGREKKYERLGLVHINVKGQSPIKSFGCNSYIVTVIDDASRKTWIHILKKKIDVFKIFTKTLVENEIWLRLKCFLLDIGGVLQ